MHETLDLFWGRALKIARHYDTDQMTFADLAGLADDFAANFQETLGELGDEQRLQTTNHLQQKLIKGSTDQSHSQSVNEALEELAASLSRIPIY